MILRPRWLWTHQRIRALSLSARGITSFINALSYLSSKDFARRKVSPSDGLTLISKDVLA